MEDIRIEDVVGLTRALVQIPSENPFGNEQACADFVANWLEEIGVEVTLLQVSENRPNVVARLIRNAEKEGNSVPDGPVVMICHMDTVPAGNGWTKDPFGGEIEGNRLFGRGAADMKGGLAASMLALKALLQSEMPRYRDIILAATIDEEGPTMKGVVDLVNRGIVTRECEIIVPEPTGLCLGVAHKGVLWYEVVTKGRMCHAGNPEVGVDANHAMVLALNALKESVGNLGYSHSLLGRPSATLGLIRGGTKVNVVPESCTAEIDFRLVPPLDCEEADNLVSKAVLKGIAVLPGSSASVTRLSLDRPPVEADVNCSVAKALSDVFRDVVGANIGLIGFPAYTDAAMASVLTGCRAAVLFGPGHLTQAHTQDEFVEIPEVATAANVLARACLKTVTWN